MSTPGETIGSSTKINVTEWLKDNKLSDVEQIFIERNIEIEELLEFETDELREFGQDIKLDILHLNRFIKAVNKLKKPLNINNNKMNYPVSSQLVVTTEENEMILQLYSKYDQILTRINKIEKESIPQLNKNTKICENEINNEIDKIITKLKRNQQILSKQIDDIKTQKIKKLKVQLKSIHTYKIQLDKQKSKYQNLLNVDTSSKNKKIEMNERKKKVINIINNALIEHKNKSKDCDILSFTTQPDIKIDFHDKTNTLKYLNDIKLNCFDGAHSPMLSIKRIKTETIKLQWSLVPVDLEKPMDSFLLEYKQIGDVSTLKKLENDKKNDDHKDDGGFFSKLKKGVSSLFDDAKDEKEEAKKSEWIKQKIKIKKKYLNLNEWEYKLDDLQANCLYYIRMCIDSNENGKSEYCETLKVITKDLALKWNKCAKYKTMPTFKKVNRVSFDKSTNLLAITTKAFSMEQNGKKVSWEIELHRVSNPSWIGFINIENVKHINVNVNYNVGSQGHHQAFGVYLSNTTMTIQNGKRDDNNRMVGATTMYTSKTVVVGDKFIFKVNFKKKIVQVQHNELNLGTIFTNIQKVIIPAVSNASTPAEYTIRLL